MHGPQPTLDLAQALKWEPGHLGIVLRGMTDGFLVEHQTMPRRGGRWGEGRGGRSWSITETGRWSLWRMAVLTLHTLWDPFDPWIPAAGVPDDPVDAVAACVQAPWLSPVGLVVAAGILEIEPTHPGRVASEKQLRSGQVFQRFRAWREAGWLEQTNDVSFSASGKLLPHMRFSDEGVQVLLRHIDALRKAGLAGGWTPSPGSVEYGKEPLCECHIEEDFLRCGMLL